MGSGCNTQGGFSFSWRAHGSGLPLCLLSVFHMLLAKSRACMILPAPSFLFESHSAHCHALLARSLPSRYGRYSSTVVPLNQAVNGAGTATLFVPKLTLPREAQPNFTFTACYAQSGNTALCGVDSVVFTVTQCVLQTRAHATSPRPVSSPAWVTKFFIFVRVQTCCSPPPIFSSPPVRRSRLVVLIDGGNVTVGARAVTLNASRSFDPDDPTATLSYTWTCLTATGQQCQTIQGQPLALQPASSVQEVLLAGSPAGLLHSFTLTVAKDDRASTAVVTVTSTAGRLPIVSLQAITAGKAREMAPQFLDARHPAVSALPRVSSPCPVHIHNLSASLSLLLLLTALPASRRTRAPQGNPSARTDLLATVNSEFPASLVTSWSQVPGSAPLLNLSDPAVAATPTSSVAFVLRPNALLGNTTYTFELAATDAVRGLWAAAAANAAECGRGRTAGTSDSPTVSCLKAD